MASPPFSINIALPGDSDIVSQHPFNARAFRDAVRSWLLVNHDTSGNHTRIDIPQSASPSSPAVNTDVLYVTTTKRLKIKHNDGTEEYVGLPPGAEIYVSGALPVGYLEKDGSAVSRATFADLFAYIGTTFGVGDGSTTFNLPDDKGRVLVGTDAAGVRLTAAGLGTAAILNAVGGVETVSLLSTQLPTHTSVNAAQAIAVNPAGNTINKVPYVPSGSFSSTSTPGGATNPILLYSGGSVAGTSDFSGNNSISTTFTNASQVAVKLVQPTRVARAVIKY